MSNNNIAELNSMIRVLFVDDDAGVLGGLKRALRKFGDDLEIFFATSAQAALQIVERQECDIIVSDVMMPGTDGIALIETIQKLYPKMARILLSGHAEEKLVLRAVKSAHRYIAKPCSPDLLYQAIKQTYAFHQFLRNPKVQLLVVGESEVPLLPESLEELASELEKETPCLEKVANLISTEVGISTKLLQIVNSDFFGLSQPIASIEAAISYLGISTLKSICLTLDLFSRSNEKIGKSILNDLRKHNLLVAACASQITIAEGAGNELAKETFAAGLLHDIGKVVIATKLPDDYAAIEKLAKNKKIPVWEAEKEVLGCNHSEIGGFILSLRGLPTSMVDVATFHHHPTKSGVDRFGPLAAVHIANCFVRSGVKSDFQHSCPIELDMNFLSKLGLSEKLPDFAVICEMTINEKLNMALLD